MVITFFLNYMRIVDFASAYMSTMRKCERDGGIQLLSGLFELGASLDQHSFCM